MLLSLVPCGRPIPWRSGGAVRTAAPWGPCPLFSEAGSNIVESLAIPVAAPPSGAEGPRNEPRRVEHETRLQASAS